MRKMREERWEKERDSSLVIKRNEAIDTKERDQNKHNQRKKAKHEH